MSFWNNVSVIGGIVGKVIDKIAPNKDAVLEKQAKLNEIELSAAPPSYFRLWRPVLGCVLVLVVIWELLVRPVLATFFPTVPLPPRMLEEAIRLLMLMMGFV